MTHEATFLDYPNVDTKLPVYSGKQWAVCICCKYREAMADALCSRAWFYNWAPLSSCILLYITTNYTERRHFFRG